MLVLSRNVIIIYDYYHECIDVNNRLKTIIKLKLYKNRTKIIAYLFSNT